MLIECGLPFNEKDKTTDNCAVVNENLMVTPNHPILVDGRWIKAGEVKSGDRLMGVDEKERSIDIVAVRSVKSVVQQVATYNLEIATYHSYVANGVVVSDKLACVSAAVLAHNIS